MIEKERNKWQPRLQGHDPGIASVDHQDLDRWSWGMVFHGSSVGISWSENEEFHGIPPKNHQKYQNHGETEKKPGTTTFFSDIQLFGSDIQGFNDESMGRWCNMDSGWVRNIVSLWFKGMDIHNRKLFWCENLGTGVLIRGHAWLSVVQCCTCRMAAGWIQDCAGEHKDYCNYLISPTRYAQGWHLSSVHTSEEGKIECTIVYPISWSKSSLYCNSLHRDSVYICVCSRTDL